MILLLGNICAQLYMVMVFVAAVMGSHGTSMLLIVAAEGVTAAGYQLQLIAPSDDESSLVLFAALASWVLALSAGLFLL